MVDVKSKIIAIMKAVDNGASMADSMAAMDAVANSITLEDCISAGAAAHEMLLRRKSHDLDDILAYTRMLSAIMTARAFKEITARQTAAAQKTNE